MDAHAFSSRPTDRGGVPAPLEGEIIPPKGRAKPAPAEAPAANAAPKPEAPVRGGSSGVLVGTLAAALVALAAAGGYWVWSGANTTGTTALAVRQMQHDLATLKSGIDGLKSSTDQARQDETVRNLKKSVDLLKAELEQSRAAAAAATTQLSAKLDKADHDPSAKLADISARLDKLENPGAKLGDIAARLDRIERQVSSPAATGSVSTPAHALPVTPMQQVSASNATEKAQPKPATIGNWIVRDVYDGIALVEGRSGGIREVTPGVFLPGAGEVRSIERRGRAWIVVTSRGIIDDSTW